MNPNEQEIYFKMIDVQYRAQQAVEIHVKMLAAIGNEAKFSRRQLYEAAVHLSLNPDSRFQNEKVSDIKEYNILPNLTSARLVTTLPLKLQLLSH